MNKCDRLPKAVALFLYAKATIAIRPEARVETATAFWTERPLGQRHRIGMWQVSPGFSTIRPTPPKIARNPYSQNSAKTTTSIRPVTPGQREGMLIQSRNILASSQSNRQHHKASTRFAGRDVWTSAIVADRRFRARCIGATTCYCN